MSRRLRSDASRALRDGTSLREQAGLCPRRAKAAFRARGLVPAIERLGWQSLGTLLYYSWRSSEHGSRHASYLHHGTRAFAFLFRGFPAMVARFVMGRSVASFFSVRKP